MSQAVETPYANGRQAAHVVFVLLLAYFVCFLDRQIITLLLPSLKADLHVSDTQVQPDSGPGLRPGLRLRRAVDGLARRSREPAQHAAGGDHFLGLWRRWPADWRVIFGSCSPRRAWPWAWARPRLSPTCASMIADYFRPTQRGRAMGVMITGAPLGAAGSLFIGGILLKSLAHGGVAAALGPPGWAPWRSVFVAIAAPGLLVAALDATLKEPPRRRELTTAQTEASPLTLVGFFRDHPSAVALFFFGMISPPGFGGHRPIVPGRPPC